MACKARYAHFCSGLRCTLLADLCLQGGVAPVLFMSVSLVDRIRTSLAAAEAAAAVAGTAPHSSDAWRSVLQVRHMVGGVEVHEVSSSSHTQPS
jgi:hypothetical protein